MRFALVTSLSVLFATSQLVVGCAPRAKSTRPGKSNGSTAAASSAVADPTHNLLKASTFEDGVLLPWMTSFSEPAKGTAEVSKGALKLRVEVPGKDRWDAQIRHREIVIQKDHEYVVSFRAWSSRPTKVTGKIGMSGPPYTDYWTRLLDLTAEPQTFSYHFKMTRTDDPTAEFAIHAGGHMVSGTGPVDVFLDDLVLSDPEFTAAPRVAAAAAPKVRVNQIGYLPTAAKGATWVSDAAEPKEWQLLDSTGKVVASGKTEPVGADMSSGEKVHNIDFGSFATAGKGYVVQVDKDRSDAFAIDANLYAHVAVDALRFFYHQRSGVEIKMPFAGEQKWARAAGHPGDAKVGCAPDAGCNYELDVSGGWYDAGDHGKYVVNGGISVWTLLNWYERTQALKGKQSLLADKTANIPESGNKIPDLLDEARFELDFLLKMQVPEGKPNAGMVHHKIHDDAWTALGTAPADDKGKRHLRPVSTAATLNLAAVAAQAARVWKSLDPAFAARCLKAAEVAYAAAKKEPSKLITAADNKGGGPYEDSDVSDEFYWAASELFLATGKADFRADMKKSPLDAAVSTTAGGDGGGTTGAMTWQRVDTLGKLSVAVVPSSLTKDELAAYRGQVSSAADVFAKASHAEGYRVPMRPGKEGLPWGSNSTVLNNMLILALAHDFAPKPEYQTAFLAGMDYLFGRNALGKSYITGYGTRPLQNPHHRFWAHQAEPSRPTPPPGIVSGGPNSSLQDPYAQAAGLKGCAPQKCFIDHIESWSTNEITINWNAPLVWVAAWADERATKH